MILIYKLPYIILTRVSIPALNSKSKIFERKKKKKKKKKDSWNQNHTGGLIVFAVWHRNKGSKMEGEGCKSFPNFYEL
jgi:hypothetical protein